MAERIFAVDENFDFPEKVTARQAARLGDATTAEGKAILAAVDGRTTVDAERLSDIASAHRQAAAGASVVKYEDATNFHESWANLSAWSSSTFGQVSEGRLYSAGQGGAAGANHAFPVPAGADFRAVFNVRTVAGLSSGGLSVGVSRDAPGATATAGAGAARTVYFRQDVAKMDNGAVTAPTPLEDRTNAGVLDALGANRNADWLVTVAGDSAYLTITARVIGTNIEHRFKWVRDDTAFPINNLYVFNSDSRQLAGHSVGFLGGRVASATVKPRTGVEGIDRTVQWTTVNGARVRVQLPKGYDSRRPSPMVIMHHGYTSDETHWQNNSNGEAVASAFVNAGYITLSAANNSNINTWGSDAGIAAYKTAYDWARARFNIGPIVAYGNSMGGLESLLVIARKAIPGIVAWIGTVPVSSLATAHAKSDFTGSLRTAYGIASDGSDYDAKTAGHDPVFMPPAAFRGLPVWALVATDDTAVPPGGHFDLLQPILAVHAAEMVRINVTGGHSTGQITSRAQEMVAFADKYAK